MGAGESRDIAVGSVSMSFTVTKWKAITALVGACSVQEVRLIALWLLEACDEAQR